jgi:hypothetical protein
MDHLPFDCGFGCVSVFMDSATGSAVFGGSDNGAYAVHHGGLLLFRKGDAI